MAGGNGGKSVSVRIARSIAQNGFMRRAVPGSEAAGGYFSGSTEPPPFTTRVTAGLPP